MHIWVICIILSLWCVIALLIIRYIEPSVFRPMMDASSSMFSKVVKEEDETDVWTVLLLEQQGVIRKEVLNHYDRKCRCVKNLSPVVRVTGHFQRSSGLITELRTAFSSVPRTPAHFLYVGVDQKLSFTFVDPTYLLCLSGQSIEVGDDTVSAGQWIRTRGATFQIANVASQREGGLFLAI